jgi:Flp pilus assembly protein TadD
MDTDKREIPRPERRLADVLLAGVCIVVIGVFFWCANSGVLELRCGKASDTYYNLLVRGFRAGQLNLPLETPPGLASLDDPYDPATNAGYRWGRGIPLHDLTFYKGKLYLYFGLTPALLLFWPWKALTGGYLLHRTAVAIFCAIGFLASAWLLRDLWRRYFSEVGLGVVVAGTFALGLASSLPILLARSDVYEVAISCGYAMSMVALAMVWGAWQGGRRSNAWLAVASLAYGLAVGARPTLLFGAVILLGPVFFAFRADQQRGRRNRVWVALLAAIVPIALVGVGLMFYNHARFSSPFDFGHAHQLINLQPRGIQFFSPRYLGFNLMAYFMEPFKLGGQFPFVQNTSPGTLPAGHYGFEEWYGGVAFGMPLVWLGLCAPLALRGRSGEARSTLGGFLVTLTVFLGTSVVILCLFFAVVTRYLVEFLPALSLLAVIGILALERAFASSRYLAVVRAGWLCLLGFSIAFNLLASVERRAGVCFDYGRFLWAAGRFDEATGQLQEARKLSPSHAEYQKALDGVLASEQALAQLREAVRLHPEDAALREQLGSTLLRSAKTDEAIEQFQRVVQLQPEAAQAHNNLGMALLQKDDVEQATFEFYQAFRLSGDAGVRNNLNELLARLLREKDAVARLQRVVGRIPESDQAHQALGIAFQNQGKYDAAIAQYQKTIDLEPQNLAAQNSLAWLLATCGDASLRNGVQSLDLARRMEVATRGQSPQILDTLAAALAENGRFDEAVQTARQAYQLAVAKTNQTLVTALKKRIELYQAHSPYHEVP